MGVRTSSNGIGKRSGHRMPSSAEGDVGPLPPVPGTPTVFLFRFTEYTGGRPNLNQIRDGVAVPEVKVANAVNLNGQLTGIGLTLTAAFSDRSGGGSAAVSVPGYFLTGELNNSWYVNSGVTGAITLTGLDPAKSYTLVAAASRDVPSTDTIRVGEFTVTAGTATPATMQLLNGANPATGTTAGNITFTVTPTAGGNVSFTYRRNAADGFAYLSGLSLTPL